MQKILDYIMNAPAQSQGSLLYILDKLHQEFPDADKTMRFGIVAFLYGKQELIYFGAYKKHIGIYVDINSLEFIRQKYPRFEFTKTGLKIPYTEPVPNELLEDLCRVLKGNFSGKAGIFYKSLEE